MGIATTLKHYTFAIVAGLSPTTPNSGGSLGDAVGALKEFVADLGIDESIKRQLVGIEQHLNAGLVDLGPYGARQAMRILPRGVLGTDDCSIYDAPPTATARERSGALVFVKYFRSLDGEIALAPRVEFVGYGGDMDSAWKSARRMPRLSAGGGGVFQKEKSFMLWYQFKNGRIEKGTIPYPFYMSVVNAE